MSGSHVSDEVELGFQIAPMLDVLFVLLLFFMVMAGLQREMHLTVPLPGGAGNRAPVYLEIGADGQVVFNGLEMDRVNDAALPQTCARLREVLASAPERPVVIRPSSGTRQQRVVDVLNACRGVGARNVGFGSMVE